MLLLILPLLIYLIGCLFFCPFLGLISWGFGIALFLLCFFVPALGLGLLFASFPVIISFTEEPPYHFSGLDLFLSLALLGVACRANVQRPRPFSTRGIKFFFLIILLLLIPSLAQFANLLSWHFWDVLLVFWSHLYYGDQLSPFAPIYRTWTIILGAILFVLARLELDFSPLAKTFLDRLVLWPGKHGSVGNFIRKTPTLDWIYYGLLAAGVILSMIAVFDLVAFRESPIDYFTVFPDKHSYAAFLVVEIALIFCAIRAHRGWQLAFFLSFLLLFLLQILFSRSRAGILAALVAVLLSVHFFRKYHLAGRSSFTRRRAFKPVVCTFFILLILVLSVPYQRSAVDALSGTVSEMNLRELYEKRIFPWRIATDMFKESPIFGVGIGRFYAVSSDHARALQNRALPGSFLGHENAHNYFLQILGETGFVGFSLALVFLYWLIFICRRRIHDGVSRAAGISLLSIVVLSVVGHPLLVNSFFYVFCAVAALVAGPVLAAPNYQIGRGFKTVLKMVSLIILCFYMGHLYSTWNKLPEEFEWGFYRPEYEDLGNGLQQEFRWTRGIALKRVEKDELSEISLRAHNPGIEKSPLAVDLYADEKRVLTTTLSDHSWHTLGIPPADLPDDFVLFIKPNRSWMPAKIGIAPDYRELGVAVLGSEIYAKEKNHGDGFVKMREFKISRSGPLVLRFSARISSGNDYWSWRVTVNGIERSSGSYLDALLTGESPAPHRYRTYQIDINGLRSLDLVGIWMKASDMVGNGVGTGGSQVLSLKDSVFRPRT